MTRKENLDNRTTTRHIEKVTLIDVSLELDRNGECKKIVFTDIIGNDYTCKTLKEVSELTEFMGFNVRQEKKTPMAKVEVLERYPILKELRDAIIKAGGQLKSEMSYNVFETYDDKEQKWRTYYWMSPKQVHNVTYVGDPQYAERIAKLKEDRDKNKVSLSEVVNDE